MGHLMRCLTLADGIKQRGSRTRFISRRLSEYWQKTLEEKGHEVVLVGNGSAEQSRDDLPHSHWLDASQAADARTTAGALSDQAWDWLVVDHYALDTRWESAMRNTAQHILVLDDLADRLHDCDVLLDQNFYADMETRYNGKVQPGCKLLLGPRYALLREEFRRERERIKPRTGRVRRVLVVFGGVDAKNCTARAIEALADISEVDLGVDVIIGEQHPFRAQIESACSKQGFACHVQTSRMAELMASADVAIGAGGSTSWERCCVGLPTMTAALAENQRRLVEDGALYGLLYAPRFQPTDTQSIKFHFRALLENPLLLQMISRNDLEAVDGRGLSRVLRVMGCSVIKIREATLADSRMLFTWRNHYSVRTVSRNREPIEWTRHQTWLSAVLTDSNRILLIGERDDVPIGTVRFDIHDREAEVSIYLAPDYIASGTGAELLFAAELWLAKQRKDVTSMIAVVLEGNQRSHDLFEAAGYRVCETMYKKTIGPYG